MATLLLDVPLEAQSKTLICWHASALMIWYYWQGQSGRQGPMQTIPEMWEKNKAASPADFITLARNVGLKEVPREKQYTSDSLKTMLETYGPIWSAGFWFGYGHIIVLTGVDGSSVHYNDPEHGGAKKTGLLAWFNTKLANQLPGCLMCKDPGAY